MSEEFWTVLGRVADSLGTLSVLATLFFSGYTFWLLRNENRRLLEAARNESPKFENIAEAIQTNEGVKSKKPVCLIISATPNNVSIRPNVEQFLKIEKFKMVIREIIMNGINTPADQQKFMDELTLQKREITAQGFTEVHLFINAPMFACILTGSVLKYWLPTKIYHFIPNSNKFYEYKTLLF